MDERTSQENTCDTNGRRSCDVGSHVREGEDGGGYDNLRSDSVGEPFRDRNRCPLTEHRLDGGSDEHQSEKCFCKTQSSYDVQSVQTGLSLPECLGAQAAMIALVAGEAT